MRDLFLLPSGMVGTSVVLQEGGIAGFDQSIGTRARMRSRPQANQWLSTPALGHLFIFITFYTFLGRTLLSQRRPFSFYCFLLIACCMYTLYSL